jgi:N6-L-threonylcarbamoyladenine synthase
MVQHGLEFSFSGLKTAVLVHLDHNGVPTDRQAVADVCASFQAAVVDVLVLKARRAVQETGLGRVHAAGGVAANRGLRAALERAAIEDGFALAIAPLRYCGDNAAMIGAAAAARVAAGWPAVVDVHPALGLDDPRTAAP